MNNRIGITGPTVAWSDVINEWCIIFYCAMIRRKVFDEIGLLDERYGEGNGEDVAFCVRAMDAGWSICEAGDPIKYTPNRIMGNFPLSHIGEVTLNDQNVVRRNMKVLADQFKRVLWSA